jgi:hypothetical protein
MLQVEPIGNDSLTVYGRMRKMFFIDRSILARLNFCFGPKPSCGEDSFVGEYFPLLIIKTLGTMNNLATVAKISPPIAVRPTIVNFSARSVRSLVPICTAISLDSLLHRSIFRLRCRLSAKRRSSLNSRWVRPLALNSRTNAAICSRLRHLLGALISLPSFSCTP